MAAPLQRLWQPSSEQRSLGASGLRGRRGLGPTNSRLLGGLIVGEIVIAVVLVVCATLLGRSVIELYKVDLGLDPENVAVVDLFAPRAI